MRPTKDAAADFLACRRIAVTGVSRWSGKHGGNVIYTKLRDAGYDVTPVNPFTETAEGDATFPDLTSIPDDIDGVVIATRPEHAERTVRECIELGITRVWMHHGTGPSSVSDVATNYAREHGVEVIDGGCPLMFGPNADSAHKCMRPVLAALGRIPRRV